MMMQGKVERTSNLVMTSTMLSRAFSRRAKLSWSTITTKVSNGCKQREALCGRWVDYSERSITRANDD